MNMALLAKTKHAPLAQEIWLTFPLVISSSQVGGILKHKHSSYLPQTFATYRIANVIISLVS